MMAKTILVSACLLGENCKYNGGNNLCPAVVRFLEKCRVEGDTVVPVCPELLSGVGVPRPPVEIVNGTIQTADGKDLDAAYRMGVEKAMEIARKTGASMAVLQSRSPTCGVHEVYDGTFTHTRIKGLGLFAAALADAGITLIDREEL